MKQNVVDCCSLANINDFRICHLDWYINIDFTTQILSCEAIQKYECIQDGANVIILDSKDLQIDRVMVCDVDAEYKLLQQVRNLGQPLEICLPPEKSVVGSVFILKITYKTSPSATATQWLLPPQTLGKKQPYLYTQCEAIHARSLLPCQDSPSCKFTYAAEVTVPKGMVSLMSAIKGEEFDVENEKKKYTFEQKIPIPSYLIAIAVGALESRSVGPRSKVWCEKEMIARCEFEFAKVEDMLSAAESLMGPYIWGDYDLLILPPSFPLGGMENPCLSFVTPTIVTGERSLTNVVVHEITHSWTGNLVTNKTWQHFWLNEGFTRFIEDKIIGILHGGEKMRQFMGIKGWDSLIDDIDLFGATNKLTALNPELDGIDPDDAFSSVPYEKGASFLYYIESLVGGPDVFNPFLRSYIEHFKFKAIVTDDFKDYLLEYFKDKIEVLGCIDWDAWLHSPGMPPINVIEMYDKTLSNSCQELCERWINALPHELHLFKDDDFSSFNTMQKIDFLTKLFQDSPLPLEYIKKMAEVYKLSSYTVSEIEFAFLRLCIRAKWSDMYDDVIKFITKQGRMKFIRPLYRELYKYEESKQLAITTFKANRHIYHNVASRMLVVDLHLST